MGLSRFDGVQIDEMRGAKRRALHIKVK